MTATPIVTIKPRGRGGRPNTGYHPVSAFRLPAELLGRVEAWAAAQPGARPNRTEAVRRLLELALRGGA